MRLYLDSSAIVPFFLDESTSDTVREWWDRAHQIITVRVSYVETRAAFARAHREGRTTDDQHRGAVDELHQRWPELHIVEVDRDLSVRAGELADSLALRGYDAVQLAAALSIEDEALIFLAGDKDLLDAARARKLHVAG